MKRIVNLAAFACVLGGGAQLSRPAPLHATMSVAAFGILYCCQSLDKNQACCYWTGCMVSSAGCFKI